MNEKSLNFYKNLDDKSDINNLMYLYNEISWKYEMLKTYIEESRQDSDDFDFNYSNKDFDFYNENITELFEWNEIFYKTNQIFLSLILDAKKILEKLEKAIKNKDIKLSKSIYRLNIESVLWQWYLKKLLEDWSELQKIYKIENYYLFLYEIISKKTQEILSDYNTISTEIANLYDKEDILRVFENYKLPDISLVSQYLDIIELKKLDTVEKFLEYLIYSEDKILREYKLYISSWKDNDKFYDLVYSIQFYSYFIENNIWFELLPNIKKIKWNYEKELNNLQNNEYKDIFKIYYKQIIEVLDDLIENIKFFAKKLWKKAILNNTLLFNQSDINNFSFPDISNIKESLKRYNFLKMQMNYELSQRKINLSIDDINY